MRTPMEFVGDLYDYQYQYYRWFLHRRVVFSELSSDDFKKFASYKIFKEDDRENVGSLVTQTTLIGSTAGTTKNLQIKKIRNLKLNRNSSVFRSRYRSCQIRC